MIKKETSMKKFLGIFKVVALLAMVVGIQQSVFATVMFKKKHCSSHSSSSHRKDSCCERLTKELNDPLIGAWAGSYFLGSTQLQANVAFNAGGTLCGQDVGDIGVGGFGTVHTGTWERIGRNIYNFMFTNVGAALPAPDELPTAGTDRLVACGTLTLSNDGQSYTGSGNVFIYSINDPPFSTLLAGPIPFTAEFVKPTCPQVTK
jgi:hypothetical protein